MNIKPGKICDCCYKRVGKFSESYKTIKGKTWYGDTEKNSHLCIGCYNAMIIKIREQRKMVSNNEQKRVPKP